MCELKGGCPVRCQDTSDPRHFGPKTFRHWCRSVRKTLRHQCRSFWTLRHWCRNVRKTLRYRSVFGVVCALICCNITIASRIGIAWRFCTRRNRFNAVYLKHGGFVLAGTVSMRDSYWLGRQDSYSASHSRSVAAVSHVSSANMPRIVKWLNCTVFFSRDCCCLAFDR